MAQKVDINHIPKFNGSYFNIWKHKLILVFKVEKVWSTISGEECLPVEPTVAKVATKIPT